MPAYDLYCPDCDHRYEDFAHMALRSTLRCPRCKGPVENDWSKQKPPAVEQDWHGSKTRSMGLLITDEERDEVLAECPAVEVNRAGQIISKNRRHHRTQMKQLKAFQARHAEQTAPEREIRRQRAEAEKAQRHAEFKETAREILRIRHARK